VERGIPAVLFHEDLDLQTPWMHTDGDLVGQSLNNDTLFEGNVRGAAATLFTLARPVAPPPVLLMVHRRAGDTPETARLDWTGGFPGYDVHRSESPADVRDNGKRQVEETFTLSAVDDRADASLLFYSVEIHP
jgi:hypothetical protein